MIVDARTVQGGKIIKADVCIIGAGAAGITIAVELMNTGIDVLLLESGGLSFDSDSQSLYEGGSTGLPYFPLASSRLRLLGGTTGHWSGWCAPLEPIDFQKRSWIPHSGWPFTYLELEPWYVKAQEVCMLGPYPYCADYWEKQDSAYKRLPLSNQKVKTKIIQFSPPVRFGRDYKDTLKKATNVTLMTYANVTNIETDQSVSHITSLEVRTLSGKTFSVEARRIVLACGGVENPRILLMSNRQCPAGLGNQYGTVGRYFMEHPHVTTSYLTLSAEVNMEFYRFKQNKAFIPLLGIPPDLQHQYKTANYSAIVVPSQIIEPPKRPSYGFSKDPSDIMNIIQTYEEADKQETVRPDPQRSSSGWALNARIEQVPNPDSRITLGEGRDMLGQRKVSLHWQLSELDRKTLRVSERVIAHELGRKQTGRMRLPEWTDEDNASWPDHLIGGWHHMGTTRMHEDKTQGVVNADCQVHGIDNLFIAGSSVFPTSGTANPTLTIVALAIRLARHIQLTLKD